MKRPYISGPIEGAEHLSREEKLARFTRAELVLREMGYDPVNPLGVSGCPTEDCNPEAVGARRLRADGVYRHAWHCWLRHDLIEMLECADGIALLPEWDQSPGAVLERHVAVSLGWEVVDLSRNAVVLGLPYELDAVRAGNVD